MGGMNSILLATDLRSTGAEIAAAAVQLGTAFGAQFSVLHVLEPMPPWPADIDPRREQAAEQLQRFAERLVSQQVEVREHLVAVGPPAETIVRKGMDLDADLILIGAGELSRYERYSMGPVATTVIEHATQPVLAIRPGGPPARFQKILCAVDQSAPAARALRNAIRLTRAFGGELIVLTVIPVVTTEMAAGLSGRYADEQTKFESVWRGEFMKVLTDSDLSGISVTQEVRHGLAHREIIAAAQEHQADLIVMGTTGRSGLARILVGSTTRRVLEHLPCSLLTARRAEPAEQTIEADLSTIQQLMEDARGLMASGSLDRAASRYRQVLAINPFHAAAVEGLAEVSDKLGESERSEFYRRRAQALRRQASA